MSDQNMSEEFKSRVYGVQIIKSKNSNYNADFSGNPRTLGDGTVYATDKVNKFNIRKYLAKDNPDVVFVKETKKSNGNPRNLIETYEKFFCKEGMKKVESQDKPEIVNNLLSKKDIRLFGATFAPKGEGDNAKGKNVSLHGPVQISYAVNRLNALKDSGMYTDQIGSPYANKKDASQTTLGAQTRSEEAYYVHHFSINPKNITSYLADFSEESEIFPVLVNQDILDLKKSMRLATTYYDSTSKKDSENELLLWIELKEDSELVLRNFTELIDVEKQGEKTIINIEKVISYLKKYSKQIKICELYCDEEFCEVKGDIKDLKKQEGKDQEIKIAEYSLNGETM